MWKGLQRTIARGMFATITIALLFSMVENESTPKLRTRRITQSTDKDFEALMNLYQRLMPAEFCSPVSDIIHWLDEQQKTNDISSTLEDYWLIGTYDNKLISFINFQYFTDSKFAFISYLGVDKEAIKGAQIARQTVLDEFQTYLQKELKDCQGIIYETDKTEPDDEAQAKLRKRARRHLFKLYARQSGFQGYELDINYISPKITFEDGGNGEEGSFALSYIPLKRLPHGATISKAETLSILKFVYMQVLGETYIYEKSADQTYQMYLQSLLQHYEATLPAKIHLL